MPPVNHLFSHALRLEMATNLAGFRPRASADAKLRHAAVAIVIVPDPETASTPCILLTRRPKTLNRHSGQYALPGGKVDPGETAIEAALRELDEELGLHLKDDRVIGTLDDYPTRSRFRITPVIVWGGENVSLRPSADEVEKVFHIPFPELDSEAIPVFEAGVEKDRPVLCSEFPTIGHRLYSPTASIIYQFREVAIRGLCTRVAHYDQPRFAWK